MMARSVCRNNQTRAVVDDEMSMLQEVEDSVESMDPLRISNNAISLLKRLIGNFDHFGINVCSANDVKVVQDALIMQKCIKSHSITP